MKNGKWIWKTEFFDAFDQAERALLERGYTRVYYQISDEYGSPYEIYFYPSDDGAEYTNVPLPTGVKFDISGNNVDGFIVTVHVNEKVEIGKENLSLTTSPYSSATTSAEETTEEISTETTVAY